MLPKEAIEQFKTCCLSKNGSEPEDIDIKLEIQQFRKLYRRVQEFKAERALKNKKPNLK